MGDAAEERDPMLSVLTRIADALERIADQDVRPQNAPLPPRRGRQRGKAPPRPPEDEVDDVTAERARRALERVGLR